MARPGDEVYFAVGGKPSTGKVLCAGKHGCQIQDGFGKIRKLKHEHILGYKARVDTSARIVDQGMDGAIVEGDDGRRRYMHGLQVDESPRRAQDVPRDAWNDLTGNAMMAKAMMGPLIDYVTSVHESAMLKAEATRSDVQSPVVDTGPIIAAVAGMFQQMEANVAARMDALSSKIGEVLGRESRIGDEARTAIAAAIEVAKRPVELRAEFTLPEQPQRAMKGTRDKDGAILLVPVEVGE